MLQSSEGPPPAKHGPTTATGKHAMPDTVSSKKPSLPWCKLGLWGFWQGLFLKDKAPGTVDGTMHCTTACGSPCDVMWELPTRRTQRPAGIALNTPAGNPIPYPMLLFKNRK